MINALLKRRMENKKKNKKGFTLVELIVVLVIIAILAAVLVPTVAGYIGRANKTADQSAAKTCYTAYSAALTDFIGENANKDADDKSDLDPYVTSYLSSDEIGKCALTFDSGAIATLVYSGSHYEVTITIDATGEISYTFS